MILDLLGAEHSGRWSTDVEEGLERTWCCLALTATDLARFGQLVLDDGAWDGIQIVDKAWLTMSAGNGHLGTWPTDYQGSSHVGHGYQWWLVDGGGLAAVGKGGPVPLHRSGGPGGRRPYGDVGGWRRLDLGPPPAGSADLNLTALTGAMK